MSEQLINIDSNIDIESIQICEYCNQQSCNNRQLHVLMSSLERLIPNAFHNIREIEDILTEIGEIRELSRESLVGLFAFMVLNARDTLLWSQFNDSNLFGLKHDITLKLSEHNVPHHKEECVICYEIKESDKFAKLNCDHLFCGDCILKTIEMNQLNKPIKCSLCRNELRNITVFDDKIIYHKIKCALYN